jgi:hypothetical protein
MKEKQPVRLSPEDIKMVGRLINNMSFVGSQLLISRRPDVCQHARANLKTLQKDFGEFVKRLDSLGSQASEVRAGRLLENRVGRLLEDIEETPTDAAGILTLANRCFLAVAFLSHCLVVGTSAPSPDTLRADLPVGAPIIR